MEATRSKLKFDRSKRLHGSRAFEAVYSARCRRHAGPLIVYGMANGLSHWRIGLSVSRRVGGAVKRNRIKRLLRESFRLGQHELPVEAGGYDMVVVVKPHEPEKLADYRRMLLEAAVGVDRVWRQQHET